MSVAAVAVVTLFAALGAFEFSLSCKRQDPPEIRAGRLAAAIVFFFVALAALALWP